MGIIKADIVESFFTAQQTASGKLSILVGMDSFCYCLTDPENRPVFLRRLSFPLSEDFSLSLPDIGEQNPLLFRPYSSISIALGMPRHVLVPKRLFHPDTARQCLEHGNRVPVTDRIRSAELPAPQAQLVYGIPSVLDAWLSRNFPQSTPFHLNEAMLQQFPAEWNTGKRLLAHLWDNRLLLYYFESGRLVFGNWFVCRDIKDYLYYILLVFDRFQLQPETQEVALSGTILSDSEIFQLLGKYIRRLSFKEWGKPLTYGEKMSAHPPHFFNDLNAVLQFRPIS